MQQQYPGMTHSGLGLLSASKICPGCTDALCYYISIKCHTLFRFCAIFGYLCAAQQQAEQLVSHP